MCSTCDDRWLGLIYRFEKVEKAEDDEADGTTKGDYENMLKDELIEILWRLKGYSYQLGC